LGARDLGDIRTFSASICHREACEAHMAVTSTGRGEVTTVDLYDYGARTDIRLPRCGQDSR
jgi:hypothetical protein